MLDKLSNNKNFQVSLIFVLFSFVRALELLERRDQMGKHEVSMRGLLNLLHDISQGRRLNHADLTKAKATYKKATKHMSKNQIKKWLRKAEVSPEDPSNNDQDELVETELKAALRQKASALFDRPYVEKAGQNDFLVMQSDDMDTFVTVIPNSIYYNIEKKCVNWLDDCSLKGIRARLLRGVQGPYK